jgi:trimethylamine:corrinoid methyltransferase-like protein
LINKKGISTMNDPSNAFIPRLTFLSEADKQKIYHAALQVLEHTGMTLQHDDAAKRLKDAGCRQDDSGVDHHSRRPGGKGGGRHAGQHPHVQP